jgi:hypothetical protein
MKNVCCLLERGAVYYDYILSYLRRMDNTSILNYIILIKVQLAFKN